jgi:hypothetical protein
MPSGALRYCTRQRQDTGHFPVRHRWTRCLRGKLRAREGDKGPVHQQMDSTSAEVAPGRQPPSGHARRGVFRCRWSGVFTRRGSLRRARGADPAERVPLEADGGGLRPSICLRQMGSRPGRQRTPRRPDPRPSWSSRRSQWQAGVEEVSPFSFM